MKDDIITNIIHDAGSIDNLISVQQDWESDSDYRDRIYGEAHDLFMWSVEDLELDILNEEGKAPYDEIRDEAIRDIATILMTGEICKRV